MEVVKDLRGNGGEQVVVKLQGDQLVRAGKDCGVQFGDLVGVEVEAHEVAHCVQCLGRNPRNDIRVQDPGSIWRWIAVSIWEIGECGMGNDGTLHTWTCLPRWICWQLSMQEQFSSCAAPCYAPRYTPNQTLTRSSFGGS